MRRHKEENWIACQGGLLKSKFQKGQTHSGYGKFLPEYSPEAKMYHFNYFEKFSLIFSWVQPRLLSGSEAGRVPLMGAIKTGLPAVVPCHAGNGNTAQLWGCQHSNRGHQGTSPGHGPGKKENHSLATGLWGEPLSYDAAEEKPQFVVTAHPSMKFLLWAWLLLPKEKVSG